jgi:hypothetical protein
MASPLCVAEPRRVRPDRRAHSEQLDIIQQLALPIV